MNGRICEESLTVFCGIDWAERHHDVALVDEAGTLLAKARITDDAAGCHKLLALLAEHGDSPDNPIPVAIETSHGLLVASLRTGSRRVFAINPLAAARYRDRHGVSRKKSDPGDALVLANILRTDMHAHRPLPADSELAQAITVLARAQQDAVWTRQQVANQVRSLRARGGSHSRLSPARRQRDPAQLPRPGAHARRPCARRAWATIEHGSPTPGR
jgi:transposase